MPRKPKTVKKYVVGNPRNLPEGVPILSYMDAKTGEETNYYEGDAFVQPADMRDDALARRISQGYIVEASDG